MWLKTATHAISGLAPLLAKTSTSDKLGPDFRTLGKSGEKVTSLGLGGFHIGHAEAEPLAQAIFEQVMESGIRFYDTAENYQKGTSKERYGKFLVPRYHDEIFLMTETGIRKA